MSTHGTQPAVDVGSLSQWQLIGLRFRRHRLGVAASFFLTLLYFLAVFAEFFAPDTREWRDLDYAYCPPQLVKLDFTDGLHVHTYMRHVDPITFRKSYEERDDLPVRLGLLVKGEPYKLWGLVPMDRHFLGVRNPRAQSEPPLNTHQSPVANPSFYLLGADQYGHDLFSRILYGSRISLSVGLIGIALTFLLGTSIGGLSGYVGGTLDNLIQRGIEIIGAIPRLPLWIALAAILPKDWSALRIYFAITVLLGLLAWPGLARVVRGKILSLREEDYAMAARLIGASHGRILFRHLLPGFTSHIIVALTLSIPGMILGETSLSFLGLGLRPPVVSWGVMLQDCMDIKAVRYYPWLLIPVLFIVLTVLCFNFLGDGMRDAADPYD